MKNSKKIAVALAMLSLAGTSAVVAQSMPDYNPSWYIAPSLNLMHPDKGFGVQDDGRGAAVRFGKPLGENWDLQFGYSYNSTRENGNRYQQQLLGEDFLYMFSRKAFRPFLLIGGGAQRDRIAMSDGYGATKTSPMINAGLGFQYGFTDQLAMQLTARVVHGFIRGDTLGIDRSNNKYLDLGLNYSFEKSPQPIRAMEPMPMPMAMAEPAPAPVPVPAPKPRFEKMTLSATELFEFNRADLRMPQPKLDDVATALKADDLNNNVVITGYTDRIGSDGYNMKLSQRRANTVKSYLVNAGVPAARLSAIGKGKANPVVVCTNKKRPALIKCLEPNRRVEVEQVTIERRVN